MNDFNGDLSKMLTKRYWWHDFFVFFLLKMYLMNIYKLTFANNDVLICKDVNDRYSLNGLYHYEHKNGKPIFAVVKADSEKEALAFVDIIHREIYETIFGIDLVN